MKRLATILCVLLSFLLPVALNAEAVDAALSEGTLTVTVDKRRRPRRRGMPIN